MLNDVGPLIELSALQINSQGIKPASRQAGIL